VVKKRKLEHDPGDGVALKAGADGKRVVVTNGTTGPQQRNGGATVSVRDSSSVRYQAAARTAGAGQGGAQSTPARPAASSASAKAATSAVRPTSAPAASASVVRGGFSSTSASSGQTSAGGPPQIPMDPVTLKTSPQPYAERQKACMSSVPLFS
jgi:hypothetical protein